MNTPDLSNTLAFFSAVAYGIRRDHPSIAASVAHLEHFVARGVTVATSGPVAQSLADRALESASANGDTRVVKLLLSLGAGGHANPAMRPVIFAYREAVRHGFADTAKELVASGLVPDWA